MALPNEPFQKILGRVVSRPFATVNETNEPPSQKSCESSRHHPTNLSCIGVPRILLGLEGEFRNPLRVRALSGAVARPHQACPIGADSEKTSRAFATNQAGLPWQEANRAIAIARQYFRKPSLLPRVELRNLSNARALSL